MSDLISASEAKQRLSKLDLNKLQIRGIVGSGETVSLSLIEAVENVKCSDVKRAVEIGKQKQ